jgi:outer membrane murein-binding lipoprotein Lpp
MTCAGCAAFQKTEQFAAQKRTLPRFPEYGQPVNVALQRDPAKQAARERAGRAKANTIIVRLRTWYDGVVRDYAMPKR